MRHGRKHRERLRAWKVSTGNAQVLNESDPETGRPRALSKYTNRPLLVMTGGTIEVPKLEWIDYDEIVRRSLEGRDPWISVRVIKRFGRDRSLEQRCWLSGVQLYLSPYGVLPGQHLAPWAVSREHLVCERNGGNHQGESNIVFVGAHINKRIGHVPLPLKLLHRHELARSNYPREDPSWETCQTVIRRIIEIEGQHRLGKGYPWQPWSFEPGTREHKVASSFFNEMLTAEQEFLALDAKSRQQWLADFRWRW